MATTLIHLESISMMLPQGLQRLLQMHLSVKQVGHTKRFLQQSFDNSFLMLFEKQKQNSLSFVVSRFLAALLGLIHPRCLLMGIVCFISRHHQSWLSSRHPLKLRHSAWKVTRTGLCGLEQVPTGNCSPQALGIVQ